MLLKALEGFAEELKVAAYSRQLCSSEGRIVSI
jgi:hypothetical protein